MTYKRNYEHINLVSKLMLVQYLCVYIQYEHKQTAVHFAIPNITLTAVKLPQFSTQVFLLKDGQTLDHQLSSLSFLSCVILIFTTRLVTILSLYLTDREPVDVQGGRDGQQLTLHQLPWVRDTVLVRPTWQHPLTTACGR